MRLRITMAVESDDGETIIKSATSSLPNYANRDQSSLRGLVRVWVDETLDQLRKQVLKPKD